MRKQTITNKLESEIFNALLSIYTNPSNVDQYGQHNVIDFSEGKLKKIMSDESFQYLKSGESKYGKFETYGGRLGIYKAINIKNGQFLKELLTK